MTDWRQRAAAFDQADPLARFRERFVQDDTPRIYLDGNSLGRMPIATAGRIEAMLRAWSSGARRRLAPLDRRAGAYG